jgi:hypothetical protein
MDGGISSDQNPGGLIDSQQNIAERVIFSWAAPSFKKSERTIRWYGVAAALILALIAYSAWQKDWFVIGIIVVASAIMFWYLHAVNPTDVNYKITPIGLYLDEKLYPFSEIHSFWMVYNASVKNVYIAYRKKYLTSLIINIENVDPVLLKGYLLKKIP